jgi:hypothetical protein
VIGILSILSGIYFIAIAGSFGQYFPGLFLGVILIGSALFYKDEKEES